MRSFAKLLFSQAVQYRHLLRESFRRVETFAKEHNFTNLLQIRHNHSNGAEQSLQVIRKFGSTRIPRIHSDENTGACVAIDFFSFKLES